MPNDQGGPTREQVVEALRGVLDPELGRSIVDLEMVKDVAVCGGSVAVEVLLTIGGCPMKESIARSVEQRLLSVPGVEAVDVRMGSMSSDQRRALVERLHQGRPAGEEDVPSKDGEPPPPARSPFLSENPRAQIVVVASGKGGVGKSTVTANLAMALAMDGRKVGVIDADVYGFSIPRMLGLTGRPTAIDRMLIPLERDGVRVMSIGFLVPDEDEAVIWRGPMLHKTLLTFINEVHWGEGLEYLLIDLPPGTGDVSLTIAQTLPHAHMVIVTTPQPTAASVAQRAGRMAEKIEMEIVGVIENMAGFSPTPGAPPLELFGSGGGLRLAQKLGVPLLGEIPIDVALRESGDAGDPIVRSAPDSTAAAVLRQIARRIAELVPVPAR